MLSCVTVSQGGVKYDFVTGCACIAPWTVVVMVRAADRYHGPHTTPITTATHAASIRAPDTPAQVVNSTAPMRNECS